MSDGFKFRDVAGYFDAHISESIPGYGELIETVLHVTPSFIQKHGKVYDLGCSTGALLKQLEERFPDVELVGYDIEPAFAKGWHRDYIHLADITEAPVDFSCVVICLFTVQFLEPSQRLPLLRRIYDSMLPGGALIIAEKTHFESGRVQDWATTTYYNQKRASFSAEEILDKGLALVPVMRPATSAQTERLLRGAGFDVVEQLWQRLHFRAWLAVKEA